MKTVKFRDSTVKKSNDPHFYLFLYQMSESIYCAMRLLKHPVLDNLGCVVLWPPAPNHQIEEHTRLQCKDSIKNSPPSLSMHNGEYCNGTFLFFLLCVP